MSATISFVVLERPYNGFEGGLAVEGADIIEIVETDLVHGGICTLTKLLELHVVHVWICKSRKDECKENIVCRVRIRSLYLE